MAKLNLGVLVDVNTRNNQTWKLGTDTVRLSDHDINKAVVLDPVNEGCVKLAADGDEIAGFIASTEPATADGATVGTVTRHASGVRQWVTGAGLKIGDLVVSGAQAAANTANAKLNNPLDAVRGTTVVKKGTPANYKWQVIRARGTDLFLIEAI